MAVSDPRYSRQMVLPEVGSEGQALLADSAVLIVGAGGLGSAAALYLAGAGVGRLIIADGDRVDVTNLHRQVLYRETDIGRAKATAAGANLHALNANVEVQTLETRLDADSLHEAVAAADAVLDCTDNFPARFAINDACRSARVPLVLGAAIRWQGQLAVFRFDRAPAPDYRSLFPESGEAAERCEEAGILGPTVGAIGSLQALEAIKLLLGLSETPSGALTLFDARRGTWKTLGPPRRSP